MALISDRDPMSPMAHNRVLPAQSNVSKIAQISLAASDVVLEGKGPENRSVINISVLRADLEKVIRSSDEVALTKLFSAAGISQALCMPCPVIGTRIVLPLSLAFEMGNKKIVELLLQKIKELGYPEKAFICQHTSIFLMILDSKKPDQQALVELLRVLPENIIKSIILHTEKPKQITFMAQYSVLCWAMKLGYIEFLEGLRKVISGTFNEVISCNYYVNFGVIYQETSKQSDDCCALVIRSGGLVKNVLQTYGELGQRKLVKSEVALSRRLCFAHAIIEELSSKKEKMAVVEEVCSINLPQDCFIFNLLDRMILVASTGPHLLTESTFNAIGVLVNRLREQGFAFPNQSLFPKVLQSLKKIPREKLFHVCLLLFPRVAVIGNFPDEISQQARQFVEKCQKELPDPETFYSFAAFLGENSFYPVSQKMVVALAKMFLDRFPDIASVVGDFPYNESTAKGLNLLASWMDLWPHMHDVVLRRQVRTINQFLITLNRLGEFEKRFPSVKHPIAVNRWLYLTMQDLGIDNIPEVDNLFAPVGVRTILYRLIFNLNEYILDRYNDETWEDIELIRSFIEELWNLHDLSLEFSSPATTEQIAAKTELFIRNLPINPLRGQRNHHCLMLTGGTLEHFVLYVINKEEGNECSVTVVNTGVGSVVSLDDESLVNSHKYVGIQVNQLSKELFLQLKTFQCPDDCFPEIIKQYPAVDEAERKYADNERSLERLIGPSFTAIGLGPKLRTQQLRSCELASFFRVVPLRLGEGLSRKVFDFILEEALEQIEDWLHDQEKLAWQALFEVFETSDKQKIIDHYKEWQRALLNF